MRLLAHRHPGTALSGSPFRNEHIDVQSFNNGLILTRTAERIYGVEASADYLSDNEQWGTGGTFTWMRGRETPQGGASQQMSGYRIPPLKLTGYLQYRPTPAWSNRLQATFFAGHDRTCPLRASC
ncbi:hypothetical protein UB46_13405 [Burkholderiaceae bacterium 16]|nr:hypothetical protein UB46_13405 [Burkholderiaceae bacterium 16]